MSYLRTATPADFPRILALNNAAVPATSPMTEERLIRIAGFSAYHKVASVDGEVAGFLLVLREGTAYSSENYRWHCDRIARFLYVDRVVIDPSFARQGLGRALYDDLFTFARKTGTQTVTLEYNLEPPNDASRVFHRGFGFQELGQERVEGGTKLVSYQSVQL